MLCAAPAIAEPNANARMKDKRTGLRPNPDTKLPTRGMTAVDAIVYALPAHMKSFPSRWLTMVGKAVDTAVWEERHERTHAVDE